MSHAEERPHGAARARGVARRAREVATRVHVDPAAAVETPSYQGLVTRTIAFTLDAAAINLVALGVGVAVGLAVSVLDLPSRAEDALVVVGGVACLVWSAAYFVVCWATTGQTPGDRLLHIRVCDADDFTTLQAVARHSAADLPSARRHPAVRGLPADPRSTIAGAASRTCWRGASSSAPTSARRARQLPRAGGGRGLRFREVR